jgi:hypothetical protein
VHIAFVVNSEIQNIKITINPRKRTFHVKKMKSRAGKSQISMCLNFEYWLKSRGFFVITPIIPAVAKSILSADSPTFITMHKTEKCQAIVELDS